MSVEFFLDTNILLYTFDQQALAKRRTAQGLVQHALTSHRGVISFQVVQEFLNVTTRKLNRRLSAAQASQYLRDILAPLCDIYPDIEIFQKALELQSRWQFSFYDSVIIAAALTAECSTLYSEDLQHEQSIESLTIINPFVEHAAIHEEIGDYKIVMATG